MLGYVMWENRLCVVYFIPDGVNHLKTHVDAVVGMIRP